MGALGLGCTRLRIVIVVFYVSGWGFAGVWGLGLRVYRVYIIHQFQDPYHTSVSALKWKVFGVQGAKSNPEP